MITHTFAIFGEDIKAGVIQGNVPDGPDFPVQTVNQVHGDKVLEVTEFIENEDGHDAMVSSVVGLRLMIKTADCIPLVLADEETEVIGAVHAGWRSLVLEIIPKTVARMIEMGASAERIKVGIGPSLGTECAEFSDARREIPGKYHWAILENGHVDLQGICSRQLDDLGVKQVEKMDICTKCDEGWFSWRRDQDVRRFGTFIELV